MMSGSIELGRALLAVKRLWARPFPRSGECQERKRVNLATFELVDENRNLQCRARNAPIS